MTLTGASIALHFDADGNLLTHLPKPKTTGGPMPRLHIDNGKLTLNQDGRKPMLVQGIKGDLTPDGADLKADGSVNDPLWGGWSLSGSLAAESGTVDLTLDAKDVNVDKAHLTGLPFVAPSVWDEVMVEGKTPCNFNLRLALQDHPTIHYRVRCAPDDAKVHVSSIAMNADHAAGTVVVDDNLVQLRGVRGHFAGGSVATDADLDFRRPAWVLTFLTVSADKISWQELPKPWVDALSPGFLKDSKLEGVFHGKATDLRVALEGGKVQVGGTGQGQIDDVMLDGKPQPDPIKVTLGTRNGKFGGVSMNPRPGLLAAALAATIGVAPPADAPSPPGPTDLVRWTMESTAWATNRGVGALGKGMKLIGTWLRPADAPEPAPEYLTLDLGLQDIDLAQLLQRLKFQLPFVVEGRLTFKVHAEVPVNTPEDLKNYRMTGTASLPHLNVAGVEMADVQTRMRLDKGVLEMTELKGTVSKAALTGRASMAVEAPWAYSGTLSVQGLDLAAAQRLAPDFRPPFNVQGSADATADLHRRSAPFPYPRQGRQAAPTWGWVRSRPIRCRSSGISTATG